MGSLKRKNSISGLILQAGTKVPGEEHFERPALPVCDLGESDSLPHGVTGKTE